MRRMTRMGAMVMPLAVIALTGCAGSGDAGDDPRPPAPIVLTASISDQRISVSPRRFGAGPISLIVVNQTDAAQRVTLESADPAGAGPGLKQETAPISPRDTATLKADVPPGRYSLRVGGHEIAPAPLRVGPERPSAQNDLLQP